MPEFDNKFCLINFPTFKEDDGTLSFLESQNHIPFKIERIFYVFNVPENSIRGKHGHINNHEVIIAISGSFEINLFDGNKTHSFTLNQPNMGLYVPPMIWVELGSFSKDAICMVINSDVYDTNDHIHSKSELRKLLMRD